MVKIVVWYTLMKIGSVKRKFTSIVPLIKHKSVKRKQGRAAYDDPLPIKI